MFGCEIIFGLLVRELIPNARNVCDGVMKVALVMKVLNINT